ncbi:MAG: hypothetical protein GEU79_14940, partial [Acidimicrobiia bacterium]|nr:hypothetical protein [Acidimicrobiia bacterium]
GLSDSLVSGLSQAGEEARCVVITGSGRAFCAGADLAALADDYAAGSPDLSGLIVNRFEPIVEALRICPVPTVAAMNGAAAGAGMGLALACDLRIMAPDAFITAAFVGIGLIPDTGSTWWLTHHLGLSRALEFVMSNRCMTADEARELGIAHRVEEDVASAALAWAGELADGAIGAMVETRRLLHVAASSDLQTALAAENEAQGRLGMSAAHREGVAAFNEKRPPDYSNL